MDYERYKDYISPEVKRLQKAEKPVPSLIVQPIKLTDIELYSASRQCRAETVVYSQSLLDNISTIGIENPIIVEYDKNLQKYVCVTGHNRVVNVIELNKKYPRSAERWGLTEYIPAYVYDTELSNYAFQVCGNIANDHPITNPFKKGDIFKALTVGISEGSVENTPTGLRAALKDMNLVSITDTTINRWINNYIENQNKNARLAGSTGTIYIPANISDHARACNFITQQGPDKQVYENGILRRIGSIQPGNKQWIGEQVHSMATAIIDIIDAGSVVKKAVLGLILTDISPMYDALPRDVALEKSRLDILKDIKFSNRVPESSLKITEVAFLPQFQSTAGQAYSDDIVTYEL